MPTASSLFTPEESRRIESAVADAEKRTAAEIVPAVATCSGRYDRAEDIVGLWTGLISLAVVWLIFERPVEPLGDWGYATGTWRLLGLGLAVVAGFIAGAWLAQYVDPLRRLFVPRAERNAEVREAALRLFHDSRVHHTQTEAGLLIYISLFEREAAVIADRAVLDQVGQSGLDDLCADLVNRLKNDSAANALCAVIQEAGDRLESVLPRSAGDRDELENTLVLID